jgi:polyhydroxybutyrate depolymerase
MTTGMKTFIGIIIVLVVLLIGVHIFLKNKTASSLPVSSSQPAQSGHTPVPIVYGATKLNLVVGSLTRQYVLYIPKSYTGSTAVPLVLGFHGGRGTAEEFMQQTSIPALAEKSGFIAVFPEGWRPFENLPANSTWNAQTWNEGSGNYPSGKANIDDVGFTKQLISTLESQYNIDPNRVYAEGFSNGAAMVLRLGVQLSNTLAAIAVASPAYLYVQNPQPSRPVPFVYSQGTADPINLFDGGHITSNGINEYRTSVDATVARMAQMDGCSAASTTVPYVPTVTLTTFSGCPTGMAVNYYIIQGMGHAWPGGLSFSPESSVGPGSTAINDTQVFWNFMSQYTLGNTF